MMARLSGITAISLVLVVALVLSPYASTAVVAKKAEPKKTSDGFYTCDEVKNMRSNGYCNSPENETLEQCNARVDYYINDCGRPDRTACVVDHGIFLFSLLAFATSHITSDGMALF
ncbi:unnamed protein product [Closterium sp. NIES-65]|nr:unnamed protein product [Closterium sp. NIES-65]